MRGDLDPLKLEDIGLEGIERGRHLHVLHNRRLHCLKELRKNFNFDEQVCKKVKIAVYVGKDPAVIRVLKKKLTTTTNGLKVFVRGGN